MSGYPTYNIEEQDMTTTTAYGYTVYETALLNAKSGIWYRAKRTANPKGTILKLQKINGQTLNIRAYNEAIDQAKAWARA